MESKEDVVQAKGLIREVVPTIKSSYRLHARDTTCDPVMDNAVLRRMVLMMHRSPAMRLFGRTLVLLSALLLVSCGFLRKEPAVTTVDHAEDPQPSRWAALLKKPKMPKMPDFSVRDLLPGPKIKVVEPREHDLRELKTGPELAKAHRRKSFADFWFFPDKLYFEEPNFPEPGAEMDGSLLPPRMP